MVAWVNRTAEEFPNGREFLRELAAILEMPLPEFIRQELSSDGWKEEEIPKNMGDYLQDWLESLNRHIDRNGDILPAIVSGGQFINERHVRDIMTEFVNEIREAQLLLARDPEIRLDKDKTEQIIKKHRAGLRLIANMVDEVQIHETMQNMPYADDSPRQRFMAAAERTPVKKENTNRLADFLLENFEAALNNTRPKDPPPFS